MIKKTLLFITLLIGSIYCFAQNQFVYVRYIPKDGNVSAITKAIDNIVNSTRGNIYVFISNASSPIIASNETEWQDAKTELLSMQTAYEYFPDEESFLLNQLYTKLFDESVYDNLHIRGKYDEQWICTYIVSQSMLNSSDMDALAENISVNELPNRMAVDILTYNEGNRLDNAEIYANTMFQFNITQ